MSEQINSNAGDTLRHGVSRALIAARLVFELAPAVLSGCLTEAVPPESAAGSPGTQDTAEGSDHTSPVG